MSMFQILTLGITCNLELDDELEESFGRRYMGLHDGGYSTCLVLVQGLLMFYNSKIISLQIPILIFLFV